MYDKFGRDWKVLEYFLLQRVCNRLQQAIIFTDSPARMAVLFVAAYRYNHSGCPAKKFIFF